ncbi:MAG: pyridoxal-phosphate dependent enzyme, partial [Gammaproteobacteria bacterium]|nr:pyridoxal-phosphate dependent enzyme [Gammaproteobacteria bacterium]
LGFDVKVVMPKGANAIKVNAVRRAGGEVIWCAASNQAREEKVAQIQRQYAAVLVPPFDDERVIAGQGTATLELLDTVEQLDAVLVPVGGGGLLAAHCSPRRALRSLVLSQIWLMTPGALLRAGNGMASTIP